MKFKIFRYPLFYQRIFFSLFLLQFVSHLLAINVQARELIIMGANWPPMEFKDENDNAVGVDVDIVKHVFGELGVEIKVKIYPFKRAWLMMVDGDVDAQLSMSKKPYREEHAYYPKTPLWKAEYVFFTRKELKNRLKIVGYDDIKRHNLTIGINAAASYHESFWKAFPSKEKEKGKYNESLEAVNSNPTKQNFRKLALKRIDLYPMAKVPGLYLIKQLGLEDELTHYDNIIFSKDYPMIFSKKSDYKDSKYPNILAVMNAFDKKLAELQKTPKYQKFFDKWLQ